MEARWRRLAGRGDEARPALPGRRSQTRGTADGAQKGLAHRSLAHRSLAHRSLAHRSQAFLTMLPRALLALGEVERGARRAQLVVEVVARRERVLAARAVHPQRAHLVRVKARVRARARARVSWILHLVHVDTLLESDAPQLTHLIRARVRVRGRAAARVRAGARVRGCGAPRL